jgi:two-component system, NtrC family, sensor kinase
VKAAGLKTKMIVAFLPVILGMGAVIGVFDYFMIKTKIIRRAQEQVHNDLRAARMTFDNELEQMENTFSCIAFTDNAAALKRCLNLDYLFVVDYARKDSVASAIARRAFSGNGSGGVRIIDSAELAAMGEEFSRRATITVKSTSMARPTDKKTVSDAMAIEYAQPYLNSQGEVTRVIYGGKIVNRYFNLIDRIHDIVFENKQYHSRPIGTVTIFQNDVRIATNVLTRDGERAIGTRVSAEVYKKVVEQGTSWIDRAFVVNDWYLTAYEPIRDINGRIVGILYVGTLEKPYIDIIRETFMRYFWILGAGAILAVIVSLLIAAGIVRPITAFVKAADNLAGGDLEHRVTEKTTTAEINRLSHSFNAMAEKIEERDRNLRQANEALIEANKRYLDLVGMVSHELKGILSSTMLNTYTVLDGYLGDLSDGQRKSLKSVARNLEYFDMTVRNFLNLSRIEKGELAVERVSFQLREEVIDHGIETFARQAAERGIEIENVVPAGITVSGDIPLCQMVVNNLLGNAIKYSTEKGTITIRARHLDAAIAVEVYNDGRPITPEQQERLFRRFSRLDAPEARRVRGSGLGLFISKEIVEKHGGTIWCEPQEKGNSFIFTIGIDTTETAIDHKKGAPS